MRSRWLLRFHANEEGATAIEYALIASLISIGITTAISSMSTTLASIFNQIASAM